MKNKEKMNLLKSYIVSNVAPILTDFIEVATLPHTIVIPANCEPSELCGYYNNDKYLAPDWYYELKNNKLLVIAKIDEITKEEQQKFIELLKYRQVSTFKIPDDISIILTANKINKDTINEELFSLVAQI